MAVDESCDQNMAMGKRSHDFHVHVHQGGPKCTFIRETFHDRGKRKLE